MEQYPVPQFIEEEGKIIFFLTVKQFGYIVAAGALILFFYYVLPFSLFIILSLLVAVIAGSLAFIKVNGTPILKLLSNMLGFSIGGKNYTWHKKESLYPFKTVKRAEVKRIEEETMLKGGQRSNLNKTKTNIELKTK